MENQKNWGNFLIIRALSGVYVSLAHLKKDSIEVTVGESVTVGKRMALCGNSGYSQEPHLHLQAQLSPEPGAHTIPFHLINYRIANRGYFHRAPLKGEALVPLTLNAVLDRLLTFRIGQKLEWKLRAAGGQEKKITFEYRLDSVTGIPFWTDGKARLYSFRTGAQFYFYGLEASAWSPLCDFFAAVPRLPMTFGQTLEFEDYLPLFMTHRAFSRFFALVKQLLSSRIGLLPARFVLDPTGFELRGEMQLPRSRAAKTYCKIDPMTGFAEFQVGDRRYVRAD